MDWKNHLLVACAEAADDAVENTASPGRTAPSSSCCVAAAVAAATVVAAVEPSRPFEHWSEQLCCWTSQTGRVVVDDDEDVDRMDCAVARPFLVRTLHFATESVASRLHPHTSYRAIDCQIHRPEPKGYSG